MTVEQRQPCPVCGWQVDLDEYVVGRRIPTRPDGVPLLSIHARCEECSTLFAVYQVLGWEHYARALEVVCG